VLIVGGILDDDELTNRSSFSGSRSFQKPFKAAELLDKVKDVLPKG